MKTFFPILVLATLLLLCSCDLFNLNNDPELPPITMEGKNTFGCLVNGKVWTPLSTFSQGGMFAELESAANTVGINIYVDNYKMDDGITLSIFDTPTLKVNHSYDLTDTIFFTQYSWHNDLLVCSYDSIISGNILITRFDIPNKIVAGTFEFKAYCLECKETVIVTNGRFDIGDVQ